MPSAANAKAEKPASTEAADNTPVRQVMTIIEHKIRNLEKRKSKLTSYRDLQKAGKELNSDQKIAVAKYDEVLQTLEFARDLSKQVAAVATVAEREAKKQAKKEAWVRNFSETNKIREVLLILDCLVQMGTPEARDDFLNGTNGAAKLTEDDLKVLDELYPEVTPKHELNEEGQPGFHQNTIKAAEHLYAIIDGKPKDILGTTYAHIKEIVTAVHECGYFDREPASEAPVEEIEEQLPVEPPVEAPVPIPGAVYPPPAGHLPVPPAPTVVPAPGYPLRPIPPITLQEVEHAYFSQQYPQQRPISEVIGSQNFFFLQESEIDSPIATPQPPVMGQLSPPPAIPTQTFTNQHFPGAVLPPPHFHEHAAFPPQVAPVPLPHSQVTLAQPQPAPAPAPTEPTPPPNRPELEAVPPENDNRDEMKEEDREEGERKQGQGDGQNRFRRFGGRGGGPRPSNGYRGRPFQPRQNSGGREYQNRNKDREYSRNYDGYNSKYNNRDNYYGNGDTEERHHENGRDRHNDSQSYGGGFKGRGRGGPRPPRDNREPRDNRDSRPPHVNRPQQYSRSKQDNAE